MNAPYGPPIPPIPPQPQRCNHLLHFILGLFTCGLWWLVWPFIAISVETNDRKRQQAYAEELARYQYNYWLWSQGHPPMY